MEHVLQCGLEGRWTNTVPAFQKITAERRKIPGNTHLILHKYMSAPPNSSLSLEKCLSQICVIWLDEDKENDVKYTKETVVKEIEQGSGMPQR